MKRLVLLFFFWLINIAFIFSQGINWQWARASKGNGQQSAYSVATDINGNVYFAGDFYGSNFTFSDSEIINPNPGYLITFLMKCNSQGSLLWSKKIGIPGTFQNALISPDLSGNIFFAGWSYSDTLIIGDSVYLTSANSDHASVYVVKYDSTGNLLWTNRTYSHSGAYVNGITADKEGNLCLTGSFFGGALTFNNYVLNQPDSENVDGHFFVAKYSAGGGIEWAKTNGPSSNSHAQGNSIVTDKDANIYVTGGYADTAIIFDTVSLFSYSKLSYSNIFIVKYDTYGGLLWATDASGNGDIGSSAMAIDDQANIYLTGFVHNDTICFGKDTLLRTASIDYYYESLFIAKYNDIGNPIWVKGVPGNTVDWGSGISTDPLGNIFVTGGFNTNTVLVFDSIPIYPATINRDPLFVLGLNSNGNELCSNALANGSFSSNSICTDNMGNVYILGMFNIDTLSIGNDTLIQTGTDNVFLAKFNCSAATGINPIFENSFLQLHPNPFTTQATVQYAQPPGSKNATLVICDILGRVRSSYVINNFNGEITINANNLSSGIYLYSLVVEGRVMVTKKMVVE